jgi:hypothetical protein
LGSRGSLAAYLGRRASAGDFINKLKRAQIYILTSDVN